MKQHYDDPAEDPIARNLITDYYERLRRVGKRLAENAGTTALGFSPGFVLPELTPALRDFFSVATARWTVLGRYGNSELVLLDLMQNPGTHTTKTLASLLMVGRALEYIWKTGERVAIVAPTSGNKGIALRDAVERAVTLGLTRPEQLRVITFAPALARAKFPGSRLGSDDELRARNPILFYTGAEPSGVKELARNFVTEYGERLRDRHNTNLWYSLDLSNYKLGDATRAFIEHELDPVRGRHREHRVHAHAVSSAYGLLGYTLGREILEDEGVTRAADRPGFLLVQHLATPDMVLHLKHGSFSSENVPRYALDVTSARYVQRIDCQFPSTTFDPNEILDQTFYTHNPPTAPEMTRLIRQYGGGGIVVSLAECLDRYAQCRRLLAGGGVELPADPRAVLEWSLVMAVVGVFNALDRGVLAKPDRVVVHGSGFYSSAMFPALDERVLSYVHTGADVARALDSWIKQ